MTKNHMVVVDEIVFRIIDRLNMSNAHTNPAHIKGNIRAFLEIVSKSFTRYIPENAKGIDIGAGYGILSEVLKPRDVLNLDIDPPEGGYGHQLKADAENIPFQDSTFDFATVFYAFHHFRDPKKAFSEACRVVKPNGHIIAMMEFLRYPGQRYFVQMNEISMNTILYGKYEPGKPHNLFQRKEFEKRARELSLETVLEKAFPSTIWYDAVYKTKKHLYVMQKKE